MNVNMKRRPLKGPAHLAVLIAVIIFILPFSGCLDDKETTPPEKGTTLYNWDLAVNAEIYGILKRTLLDIDLDAPDFNATLTITDVTQHTVTLDWVNHYPQFNNDTNTTETATNSGTVAVNGFGDAHEFTPPWYFNDTFSQTPSSMVWLSREVFQEVTDPDTNFTSDFDFDFWGEPALWIVKEIIEVLGFDVEFNLTFVEDVTYRVMHDGQEIYLDAMRLTDPLNNYYIVQDNADNPLVLEFHYGFNNWTAWEFTHTDPTVNILTAWNIWTTGLGYKVLELNEGTTREVGTYEG